MHSFEEDTLVSRGSRSFYKVIRERITSQPWFQKKSLLYRSPSPMRITPRSPVTNISTHLILEDAC